MKPYYQDNHIKFWCMDFRQNGLPDESVQCVVTSPPFWGLRKYSGEQDLIWGGDNNCEHMWETKKHMHNWERKQSPLTGIASQVQADATGYRYSNLCSLCGAWRGAYGLEPTPDCGRPFMKLREDLTDKELEYVMGELKRCGLE